MSSGPRRSSSAVDIEVDHHRVVFDGHAVRLLDPLGSLIWSLLDGTASLDELAEDLSAVFETPVSDVRPKLDEFITELESDGLIDGEAPIVQVPPAGPVVLPNPPSP